MASQTIVRVRNADPNGQSFSDGWDGTTYEIGPGEEAIVPYEAVINWVGDPGAIDYGPERRDRLDEYKRLRVRYGAYENDQLWDDNRPHLEVFHLTGEPITTVIDDPTGQNVTPEVKTALENKTLQDQVAILSQQLQAVQSALSQQSGGKADIGASDPASTPGELVDVDGEQVPSGATEPGPEEPAAPFGTSPKSSFDDPSDTISHSTNDKVKGESTDKNAAGFKAPTDSPSKVPTSQQNKTR